MPFCFGNKMKNINFWIYPSDQLGLQPLSTEASLRGLQFLEVNLVASPKKFWGSAKQILRGWVCGRRHRRWQRTSPKLLRFPKLLSTPTQRGDTSGEDSWERLVCCFSGTVTREFEWSCTTRIFFGSIEWYSTMFMKLLPVWLKRHILSSVPI